MRLFLNYHSNSAKLFFIKASVLIFFGLMIGQNSYSQSSSFVDDRDGREYKTVKLNGITWMVNNLDYKTEKGSFYYENNTKFKGRAGRLYTFPVAKKACPQGWRLPTLEEWEELINSYGGLKDAYTALALRGNTGLNITWGGLRHPSGKFMNKTKVGSYWTSTPHSNDRSKAWRVNFKRADQVIKKNVVPKRIAMSCRCVKGDKKTSSSNESKTDELYKLTVTNNSAWKIRIRVKLVGHDFGGWINLNPKEEPILVKATDYFYYEKYEIQYLDLTTWKNIHPKSVLVEKGNNLFNINGDLFSGISMSRQ